MTLPWDDGITWFSTVVTPPTGLAVDLGYIRDKVLRVANDSVEDGHIELLIAAATELAEADTDRSLMPQTRAMVLSGFPTGPIVLQGPPLIDVVGIDYVDTGGTAQTLAASPADFLVVPSGRRSKAAVAPLPDTTWPSTRVQPDAVTVTYQCGYANADEIPATIKAGIGLLVGELYTHRTLSVHAVHNTPSVIQLRRLWRQVR